jgi:hypothetical protein
MMTAKIARSIDFILTVYNTVWYYYFYQLVVRSLERCFKITHYTILIKVYNCVYQVRNTAKRSFERKVGKPEKMSATAMEEDVGQEILRSTTDDIYNRTRLLENEIKVYRCLYIHSTVHNGYCRSLRVNCNDWSMKSPPWRKRLKRTRKRLNSTRPFPTWLAML